MRGFEGSFVTVCVTERSSVGVCFYKKDGNVHVLPRILKEYIAYV
jgi:hypothetical protein